jgi:predicted nucleic acid-binding protein
VAQLPRADFRGAAVEVVRAARATGRTAAVERARRVIDGCALIELDAELRSSAGLVDPPCLRSLDAIHLASALSMRDHIDAVVSYDRRLARAAAAAGLPVVSPT